MRLVLGLINPDEQEVLRKHAKKAAEHEEGVREKPKIDFWVKRSRAKLEAMLDRKVADPRDPLLQQEIDALVRANEKKALLGTASAEFVIKGIDRLGGCCLVREKRIGGSLERCPAWMDSANSQRRNAICNQHARKQRMQNNKWPCVMQYPFSRVIAHSR